MFSLANCFCFLKKRMLAGGSERPLLTENGELKSKKEVVSQKEKQNANQNHTRNMY